MPQQPYELYPSIEPYFSGYLAVSAIHTIYYEECGNPLGQPVVFLHGGPGSGCNPGQRRFFDPAHYRIILLDQRGCGRSKPLGITEENTTADLIADIEKLRNHLNIQRWLVFGGSWGSTLALAYAIDHPTVTTGLILRGIFLSRPTELRWFLQEVQHFYPEPWEALLDFLKPSERVNVLAAYAQRVFSEDVAISTPAAVHWNAYESSIMTLRPSNESGTPVPDEIQLARARVQLHYIVHDCFVDGHRILNDASIKLAHIPTTIIQGRYDMVCPPVSAWQLKQAMPNAKFELIADAGHSAMEPGTAAALVAATEAYKLPDQK